MSMKDTVKVLAPTFGVLFLILAIVGGFFWELNNYGTRYHLVVEQHYNQPPMYAMEACYVFDHDCNTFGYHWDYTPTGKIEAMNHIEWFRNYKKTTINRIPE